MLLSNLTKLDSLSLTLLKLSLPSSSGKSIPAVESIVDVFIRGEGKRLNKNASYDFLASVLANISTVSPSFLIYPS